MKRLLLSALLLSGCLQATIVTGRITDLVGQTVGANRKLTFDLMNCPTGSVRVIGATVVVPTSANLFPNPAGLLAGAIIGNDIIACDSTVGQTWYKVGIWIGNTKAFEKNYRITGATWDISTAVPLVSDPTAFLTYTGYQLGDIIYGSGLNAISLLRGNTSTRKKYLTQVGDGFGNSGQPYWSEIAVDDGPVPVALPILDGDVTNVDTGSSLTLRVTSLNGISVSSISAALAAMSEATPNATPNTVALRDENGAIAASLIGNASTASALAAKPTGCPNTGVFATDIQANGNLSCYPVDWVNVANRPTALSAFSNDSAFINAAGADARIAAQKGVANGLATLGSDGKVSSSQLPAVTSVTWSSLSGKPAWTTAQATPGTFLWLNQIGCGSGWQEVSCDSSNNGIMDYADQAGVANSVAWANVSGKPNLLLGNGTSYSNLVASPTYGTGLFDSGLQIREVAYAGYGTGSPTEAPRLTFHWAGRVASQIALGADGAIEFRNNPGTAYERVRTGELDVNGYVFTDIVNMSWPQESGQPISSVIVETNSDGYLRRYSTANAAKAILGSLPKQFSFSWFDPSNVLPTGYTTGEVFRAAAHVFLSPISLVCTSDTGDAVINLYRTDDTVNGKISTQNMTCGASGSAYGVTAGTSLDTAYAYAPLGAGFVLKYISGTAKKISVTVAYNASY